MSGGTVEVRNGWFGPYVALVMPSAEDAGDTAAESAAGKAGKTKRSGGWAEGGFRPSEDGVAVQDDESRIADVGRRAETAEPAARSRLLR